MGPLLSHRSWRFGWLGVALLVVAFAGGIGFSLCKDPLDGPLAEVPSASKRSSDGHKPSGSRDSASPKDGKNKDEAIIQGGPHKVKEAPEGTNYYLRGNSTIPLNPAAKSEIQGSTAAAAAASAASASAAASSQHPKPTPKIERPKTLLTGKPSSRPSAARGGDVSRRSSLYRRLARLQGQRLRLHVPRNSGLLGSRMRRRLGWRIDHPQQASKASWVGSPAPGSSSWIPGSTLSQVNVETDEDLLDKCFLAFRGDAISHKADPIGRSGPRNLRLLSCQMAFARDGGRQRDSGPHLTLRDVSVSSPPASAFREHRMGSGAVVVLVSCPGCPRSAVSFYLRREPPGRDMQLMSFGGGPTSKTKGKGGPLLLSPPVPGCSADFAMAELGGVYRALGVARPWIRQSVVCSGSGVHFAAVSKPAEFPMLVEAMASQLTDPLIDENEGEKAFIAAASSFNAHLLYGHPRAVAVHLSLKCGEGRISDIHYGTWGSLNSWADKQGLSLQEAVRRYHEATYTPGQMVVAVVDRRPLHSIETAIGSSLSFLAYPSAPGPAEAFDTPPYSSLPAQENPFKEADKETESACTTPALHYLECTADLQGPRVFFSFFLSPAKTRQASASMENNEAATKTTETATKKDIAVSLRSRRILAAMLSASGRDSLLARLTDSGGAQNAAVHLPISNDSGALLQIEVGLAHGDLMKTLGDVGEMIFAFIAALAESPPGAWFVAEQQKLSAFDQIFSLQTDILQTAVDIATDTAHGSDFGVADFSDLLTAEAAATRLLKELSPSRLHLVLQSAGVDVLCSRIQQQTLARHGEGSIDPHVYRRWLAAFNSRNASLQGLLSRWGLALPKKNPFASWARKGQSLFLHWEKEEPDDTNLTSAYPTPLPSPTPGFLSEAPLKTFEALGIPRKPPSSSLPYRLQRKLSLDLASPNNSSSNTSSRRGSITTVPEDGRGDSYIKISFPASHPCHNRCHVRYKKCQSPQDPRATVSLRLNSWVGQRLVPREEAAAEVFLALVGRHTQAVIEEASRAGVSAASSAGSFAAETHDSSIRRSDTIVLSVSGPSASLKSVLLALLLPLSPSPTSGGSAASSAANSAASTEVTTASVTAANNSLLAMLEEIPKPDLLLTETALDLLVEPQKTREGLLREIGRAGVDRRLVIAWRDGLWRRMALQATFEGNICIEAARNIISLVLATLRPTELVSTTEALPTRVLDLRGVGSMMPPISPLSLGLAEERQADMRIKKIPPTALYIHPAVSAAAFHAVRVYVQLGQLGPDAAAAAAAAGEWFAAALSYRLRKAGRVLSTAKPPYFVFIGGIGYLSCTITSNLHMQGLIVALDQAVRSLALLSEEEALREVELSTEWSPISRDVYHCPFSPICPEHVNRAEQPLLELGIEMSLRALRETPRLLLGIRGSLVSRGGNLGYSFGADGRELGEMEGFIQIREPNTFKETLGAQGFYFNAVPNF